MGWRSALRSAAAADRRNKQQTHRQLSKLGRLENDVDRVVDNLDAECERDLGKVADAEARIMQRPLTAGGLTFDRADGTWAFKEIADKTGDFKWSIKPTMTSDPVRFVGAPFVNGARQYNPVALSFARWGIFIAFEVSPAPVASKPRKLFTKSDPTKNRMFLRCGDAMYQAIEGDLDRDVIGSGITIAAFPLPDPATFGSPVQVELHTSDEPPTIAVQGDNLLAFVQDARKSKSLVDRAAEQFRQALAPVRTKAAATKAEIAQAAERAKGGCLVLIATIGAAGGLGALALAVRM